MCEHDWEIIISHSVIEVACGAYWECKDCHEVRDLVNPDEIAAILKRINDLEIAVAYG